MRLPMKQNCSVAYFLFPRMSQQSLIRAKRNWLHRFKQRMKRIKPIQTTKLPNEG